MTGALLDSGSGVRGGIGFGSGSTGLEFLMFWCVLCLCYDAIMRTTLTLDDDLSAALKEIAFNREVTLKKVINETLRAGLRAKLLPPPSKPYRLQPAGLGQVSPGIDLDRVLRLADALEDECLVGKIEARK